MKRNILKTAVSSLMITIMLSGTVASAQTAEKPAAEKPAVSGPVLTLSLENIERLMLERSPVIKKIKNDTWTYEKKYDDLEDTISDLNDQIDRLNSQKDDQGKPVDNSARISTLYGQISSLSSSRNQLDLTADLANATMDQQISQQIQRAKQLFVNCLADQEMLTVSSSKNTQTQRSLEIVAEKLKRGYISKNAYDAIVNSAGESDINLSSQSAAAASSLAELRALLGADKRTTLELESVEISDTELEKIENLNFEEDLKNLMNTSATIKSAQISYDVKSRSTDYSEYEEDSAQAALQTAKDSVSSSFTRQYDSLMNSYKSLKIAQEKLRLAQKTEAVQKTLFERGFISQTTFENTQISTQTMESQVAAAKTCFMYRLKATDRQDQENRIYAHAFPGKRRS